MKATLVSSLVTAILLPSLAFAQTSGNIATDAAQNWSTAPWAITAGAGTYPDSGGVATFNTVTNTTVGTVSAGSTFTLDVSPTLSGMNVNSPFSYAIVAGAGTLNLDPGGATFNMNQTAMSTPSLTYFGTQIATAISGGGTSGLTMNGPGTLTLEAASTYTGGTTVNGGTLALYSSSSALAESTLGAAGTGLALNGATFAVEVVSGSTAVTWTTARNITLGSGGGTLLLFTPLVVNGVVSGTGSLTINNSGLTLSNTNTYSGATILNSSFSTLTINGSGTINQSSGIDLAGTLTLTNATTNNSDRLNDSGTITDRGATIAMSGNASAATAELAGSLVLADGVSRLTVTPNAAQAASLIFSSITRQNNSTLYTRGTNLGNTAGNGVAEIISVASPGALVGGGGAAASQNISILPWAAGNASASATTNSSFVTWDPVTGQFRPLVVATEYATLASGANSTNNTKVTAATAIASATTVNAVLVTGTGSLLSGTGGLTITSGALMYSPTNTTAGTISASINFGSAEGVISTTAGAANSVSAGLTVSGVISGSGGVTLNSITGSDIVLTNANNSYTGTTTLTGGLVIVNGTIAKGANSIFGADTSAIVLNASNNTNLNGLYASLATTMNRDLSILGSSTNSAFIVSTANIAYTQNGNANIAANCRLDLYNTAGATAATGFIFNGNITGAGSITDNNTATTFVTLSGNNSYSGGTNILAGTYQAGSDSAFGSGTIYFSSTGAIQSKDTTSHTITNNVFLGATPTFSGAGGLNFSGGINLNGAQTVSVTNTAAAGTAFSGVVSNGALTKTGTGILSLNSLSGNNYTGGTVLAAASGALNVNNTSGSGTGPGTVSIGGTSSADRSTLEGSFTISGATMDSGALSPGNFGLSAIGTANFGSALTLTANSLVTEELASSSSADQINVMGALSFGGSAFVVDTIGGYEAQLGDTFQLLTWGSVNGTATINVSAATLADPVGTMWDTSNFLTSGTIDVVAAVPEPSAILLTMWGAGLIGGNALRRRRRSKLA